MNDATRAVLLATVLVVAAVGSVVAATLFTAGSGTMFDDPDGPAVTLGANQDLDGSNPFTPSDEVVIGNTTVGGPAGSTVTLTGADADSPTLSSIDSNGGQLTADSVGIQQVGVNESITQLSYQDVDLGDDQTTELSAQGTGFVFVYGFGSGETLRVNRANGDDTLETADSNGVVQISVTESAEMTLVEDGGGPTLSDPSPTGGETVSATPAELQVNVSDPDFDTANEAVDLEWYINGSLDGTTTVTSNGTATFTSSARTGGAKAWHVEATDSTGQTDRSPDSGAHQFELPSVLEIREEGNPDQLVGSPSNPVEVEVRFFQDGDEQVIERTTTDGAVNLTGLPAGKRFIVTAAAENYTFRRIVVDSLTEQQSIYLLNEETPSASVIFELQDRTGQFDARESTLYVERALNQSNSTEYRVIAGDKFGGSREFPVDLVSDARYRLRIENAQGDIRTLGSYTATGDQRVQLQVGEFDFEVGEAGESGYTSQATVEEDGGGNETLRWAFADPDGATGALDVAIYERDNRSNELLNESYSDLGNVSYTQQLTGNQTGRAWVIDLSGTRNGERFTSRQVVGETDLAPGIPLDPFYQEMFAVLLLLVLAGVFGGVRAEAGAIIVPMSAGVLFWMGWLPGVVTAGAVLVALFIGVLYRIRSTPQPGVR